MCRNHQFDPILQLPSNIIPKTSSTITNQDRIRATELECSDLMSQWGKYAVRIRSEKEATLHMIDQSEERYHRAVTEVHEHLRQSVDIVRSIEIRYVSSNRFWNNWRNLIKTLIKAIWIQSTRRFFVVYRFQRML